jgi:hypothetical protein
MPPLTIRSEGMAKKKAAPKKIVEEKAPAKPEKKVPSLAEKILENLRVALLKCGKTDLARHEVVALVQEVLAKTK